MKSLCFTALLICVASYVSAQGHIVKDINTRPADYSSYITSYNNVVSVGDYVIFPMDIRGKGKWHISDGTTAGTRPVVQDNNDLETHTGGARLGGDFVYTTTIDGQYFLMKYTPGDEAPEVVTQFDHPMNMNMIRQGDVVMFLSNDAVHAELWKTDGTEAGTLLVENFPVGYSLDKTNSDNDTYTYFTLLTSGDYSYIMSLWRTDGTEAGTIQLMNGTSAFDPTIWDLYVTGNNAFFGLTKYSSGEANEFWTSDGTVAGTVKLIDLQGQPDQHATQKVGTKVMFRALYDDIYITDGTPAGTHALGYGGSGGWATEYKGLYYFLDGFGPHVYLNKSDGTIGGTTNIMDLGSGYIISNGPWYHLGDKLIVAYETDGKGVELAISDGTVAGITLIKDINPGPAGSNIREITPVGSNKMFFFADDGVHGWEPWITDGTEAGTHLVIDTKPGTSDTMPFETNYALNPVGDHLSFIAGKIGPSGAGDLWVTNGTEANTNKVYSSQAANWLGNIGNDAYYLQTANYKIVTVSGLTLQASEVKDMSSVHLYNGGFTYHRYSLTLNGKLLFSTSYDDASHNNYGNEWWVTDGTDAGTHIVKDINPGTPGSNPYATETNIWHDKMYFGANDGVNGTELWVTDGTDADTTLLKDLNPGSSGSSPDSFYEINNKLFFIGDDGTDKIEFWTSDGTADGTTVAFDMFEDDAMILTTTKFKDQVFFSIRRTGIGWQLWKTDGTLNGTKLVKQFNVDTDFKYWISRFAPTKDRLFFAVDDGQHGRELWVTDEVNTQMIELTPGKQGSIPATLDPEPIMAFNDVAYFATTFGMSRSAGTEGMTEQVWNEPVVGMQGLNDQLFFVPNDKDYGQELFVMPFTKFEQLLTFDALSDKTEGDPDFTLSGLATSGLPVTFKTSPTTKVKVTGNAVKILKPGKITFYAGQVGNEGIVSVEKSQTICINPAKPAITLQQDKGSSEVLQSSAADGNQWYLNGEKISGATSTTFKATESGNYTVAANVEECQGATSNAMAVAVTGLEDDNSVSVFPNPAKDKLYVQWSGNAGAVTLMGIRGESYTSTSFVDRTEIPVSHLAAGVYIVKIATSGKQIVKKFIKE
jgi:ELWxxDGT repeat protein